MIQKKTHRKDKGQNDFRLFSSNNGNCKTKKGIVSLKF